jgi:hypothetical protein
MATLLRRAGKRRFVAQHFERQLRRDASRALALDPSADEQTIRRQARDRGHDADPFLGVLARLRDENMDEGELLRLVGRAEEQIGAFRRPGAKIRLGASGDREPAVAVAPRPL